MCRWKPWRSKSADTPHLASSRFKQENSAATLKAVTRSEKLRVICFLGTEGLIRRLHRLGSRRSVAACRPTVRKGLPFPKSRKDILRDYASTQAQLRKKLDGLCRVRRALPRWERQSCSASP